MSAYHAIPLEYYHDADADAEFKADQQRAQDAIDAVEEAHAALVAALNFCLKAEWGEDGLQFVRKALIDISTVKEWSK